MMSLTYLLRNLFLAFLFYFQTFNLVIDSGLCMLYVESTDDNVEQGDEEDHHLETSLMTIMKILEIFYHRGCVVQNIGRLLMVGVVDVEPSKDEEEDADQHLRIDKVHISSSPSSYKGRGGHIRKIVMT